jgi:hypothetical protein
MTSKAARYVLWGQISLFGWLLICFLLIPHFLLESNEGGVSNYGLYLKTVVPYTLAFGLGGGLTLRAACLLPTSASYRPLRRTLIFLGVWLLVILLSTYPYKLNNTFNDLHLGAGILLFIAETLLAGWFALVLASDTANRLLWTAQLVGFSLAGLTFFGVLHVLFIAQMLNSAAFGALLVRTVTNFNVLNNA